MMKPSRQRGELAFERLQSWQAIGWKVIKTCNLVCRATLRGALLQQAFIFQYQVVSCILTCETPRDAPTKKEFWQAPHGKKTLTLALAP